MTRQHLIRRAVAALALTVCAALPVAAPAGMLDKWFKKGDGGRPQAARYDREPSLVFDGGKLTIDISGRWRLGGSVLVITDDSEILEGGRAIDGRRLRMGQEARLTGHRLADGSVAVRRLRLLVGRQQLQGLGGLESLDRPVGEAPAGGPR